MLMLIKAQTNTAYLLSTGAVLLLQEGLCWGQLLLLHPLHALPLCCLLRTQQSLNLPCRCSERVPVYVKGTDVAADKADTCSSWQPI
jgi:hypothetical protein